MVSFSRLTAAQCSRASRCHIGSSLSLDEHLLHLGAAAGLGLELVTSSFVAVNTLVRFLATFPLNFFYKVQVYFIVLITNQVQWYVPLIPGLRQRHRDQEFKVISGYTVNFCMRRGVLTPIPVM